MTSALGSGRVVSSRAPRVADALRGLKHRKESVIQAEILKALRALPGVCAFKTGGGLLPVNGRRVRMGHKGVSDIIGWVERQGWTGDSEPARVAVFFACEVKRKGKEPSDAQRAFLDAVQAAGGIAVCAYDVSDVLKALGVEKP